ncbi:membrane protein DedA, SNARE-associated domain [Actinacidiphila yanglinensis]|uniref:Membrane protein DedA, SNARE-associated domain n=1 Tax=Actinacidiphila yanglinensis TaxID=310779 RepID=A0A1H5SJI0_9ACTN|nr:VTT domain-containing protein [Actinacidiphila yanglinensis]SEF49961.1 membrane protein DedA, SNARE-associated domain [Actinacidiphila yanglinensis]
MLHHMGSLFDWPWIYVLVGLSVLLDVFVPVLPSGVLVISAATSGSTGARDGVLDILVLLVCAATASCVGDLLAYRLAWRGGAWFDRRIARSRRLAAAHERLGQVLSSGGGALVVLARFAPAGRSVVSLGAGAARRRPREFLPWSALAGVCWATYSVGLGWVGGRWLGASWFGTLMSFFALLGAGAFAAMIFRRERRHAIEAAAFAAAQLTAEPLPAEPVLPEPLTAAPLAVAPLAASPLGATALTGQIGPLIPPLPTFAPSFSAPSLSAGPLGGIPPQTTPPERGAVIEAI